MRKTALLIIPVALSMLITILPAYATPPTTVSGKWAMTGGTTVETKSAGNNGFLHLHGTGYFIGSISGPFTSEAYWRAHKVGTPDQWSNGHVVITISPAKVGVKTGTLVFMFNGILGRDGSWVIISSTGELANLHGQGTFSSTGGFPQIAYEGQIHFDP